MDDKFNLRKEHEDILNVLDITDKVTIWKGTRLFIKTFADKCHHGKEDNYLLKELENQGIPNEGGQST